MESKATHSIQDSHHPGCFREDDPTGRSVTLAARMMKASGVAVFVVGIGGRTNYSELLQMAGGRKDRVYMLRRHDDIHYSLNDNYAVSAIFNHAM